MKEINFYLKDPLGLHMRPAAKFAGVASKSKSTIQIIKDDGQTVDARMMLMVIRMGIKQADEFKIRVEGEDEDTVATELSGMLGIL